MSHESSSQGPGGSLHNSKLMTHNFTAARNENREPVNQSCVRSAALLGLAKQA